MSHRASRFACAAFVLAGVVPMARVDARATVRVTGPPPATAAAPTTVLGGYAVALETLARPKALSFDYTVSQLGLHDFEQTHHVYRSGLDERDETRSVVVNGDTLPASTVRIIRNRTYRYDISSVAPRPIAYAFVYSGAARDAQNYTYHFRTLPREASAFAVTEIEIDGRTLLPSTVRFKIAGGGARGDGALLYGRSESHWVVREARVTATLADGSTARERIVWSNYRFYDSLPQATFAAPATRATPAATSEPNAPL